MNLKDKTVPELWEVLRALLAHGVTENDTRVVLVLSELRTFSRAEKVLISTLCSKYRITQEQVDKQLVEAR